VRFRKSFSATKGPYYNYFLKNPVSHEKKIQHELFPKASIVNTTKKNLGGNQFPHLGSVGWVTPWQFLGTNLDGLFVFPKDKYDYVLQYTKKLTLC